MPRGLFQMGTLGWTPAAQLATQNQSGAAASYASMDKAVNQTQTTKVSGGSGSIFGDILPIVGAGVGAMFGPAGMAVGSGIGGALGSAAGMPRRLAGLAFRGPGCSVRIWGLPEPK